MIGRRRVLQGVAACAAAPWRAARAQPAQDDVQGLLRAGETALARGDIQAAQAAFERAALMAHEPQIEMALVRAAMQAGRYGVALALAGHAAAAHRAGPGPAVQHAWLLAAGGRPELAQRVLQELPAAWADDALVVAARARLQPDGAAAAAVGPLLDLPHRVAPRAWGAEPSPHAVVVANALLAGAQAIAPAAPLAGAGGLWVRSALGPTVAARAQACGVPGLARLLLAAPLDVPAVSMAAADPAGGTPLYGVAAAPTSAPCWPWLFRGFAMPLALSASTRRPGFATPGAAEGAVVLDAAGQVCGLALQQAGGRLVGIEALRTLGGALAAPARAQGRAPLEEVYQAALAAAVQVLAEPA